MADRQKLATIEFITDTETSYEFIGEVDGGFDQKTLENYISRFGIEHLSKHLSYLQWQMFDTMRKLNAANDQTQAAKQG